MPNSAIPPEVLDLLMQQGWIEGMRSPTQGAISDRLRPPYLSPLEGMAAVNAPASRDLEVGFNNLPWEYQALLQAAPPRNVNVGEVPDALLAMGLGGVTTSGADADMMLSPGSGSHELVHELGQREGNVMFPWNLRRDEALARLVGGVSNPEVNQPAPEQYDLGELQSAIALDQALRQRGREVGLRSLLAEDAQGGP